MSETADAPLWLSYSPRLDISELEAEAKILADEGRLRLIAIDNIDAVIAASGSPADTSTTLNNLLQASCAYSRDSKYARFP